MPPLNPDRWRALSPYLDEALAMTSDRRGPWLAEIRARDAALGADLESLLAEHEHLQESRYLERPVALVQHSAAVQLLEGQIVGAYRLISLIGQGGMGSVWLAARCDGRFEGRAAVKLLNIALLGRAGEERFRREGNFLAKVTHPHIARLIDAGLSSGGQPYLVLEHVDGQTIDRYCDEQALGIDARIRLFLDVLEAVAHAHANLIVHRDIKPANVLVSVDGRVKLLDFGIAKLLEDDSEWSDSGIAKTSALTREGAAPLTPEYAAPEQLAQGPVTTATDVRARCAPVRPAHRPTSRRRRRPLTSHADPRRRRSGAAPDVRRRCRAGQKCRTRSLVTPPGAAQRWASCAGALREISTPSSPRRSKKDARERYASVTALADDLRRSLRHEPISARPDTLRYRAN